MRTLSPHCTTVRRGPGMPTSAGFTDLIGFPRSAELTQRYS
jgi:hypothetical protein